MTKKYANPFSDGTLEDCKVWQRRALERRSKITATFAVDKILEYLSQQAVVLKADVDRYRNQRDMVRWEEAVARLQWTESMIFWVNHNV